MKKVFVMIYLLSSFCLAQESDSKWRFGTETDFVPFIAGGYYSSLWVGYENFRFRTVLADIPMPEFMTPDNFEEYEVKANAIIVDYFFSSKLDGFWIAGGVEFWNNRAINSKNKITGKFDRTVYTLGCGYVIDIWKNIYINPWCAVHYVPKRENEIIGGFVFDEKKIVPEVSVKLGLRF